MASYTAKPQIDPLVREAMETQKRALRAEERKKVLLDARTRMYGIDTDALAAQKAEKDEMAKVEMERDLYYDNLMVYNANRIKDLEREKQVAKRQHNIAEKNERETHIKYRDSLRAEAIKKGDAYGDVKSDFLTFQGEDPDRTARMKAMQIQQQDWLAQQIAELSSKEEFEKKEQAEYDAKQAKFNEVMTRDEQEMAHELKTRRHQIQAENKALAAEKRRRELEDIELNKSLNEMEIANQTNSAYLNEKYAGTNDGRVGFKGFSQEQLQAILDEQEYQRQVKTGIKAAEMERDAAYDMEQAEIRRMMILADRQKIRNQKAALLQLREERKVQALAKTEKYNYLDTVMFSDPIQESYFEQFGTSGR